MGACGLAACGRKAVVSIGLSRPCGHRDSRVAPVLPICAGHAEYYVGDGQAPNASTCEVCGVRNHVQHEWPGDLSDAGGRVEP